MPHQRYNMYQYETNPRKLEPEYDPIRDRIEKKKSSTGKQVKKNASKKARKQMKPRAKLVILIGVAFSVLFVAGYRNSLITESFNEKEDLKKTLGTYQKENEQLKVSIENSLNLSNVEQLAKERLGMQKLENSQKVYISLQKKDYIEPATEEVIIEDNDTIWQKLLKGLTGSIR